MDKHEQQNLSNDSVVETVETVDSTTMISFDTLSTQIQTSHEEKKQLLSRPERKALERAKKEQQQGTNRVSNNSNRNNIRNTRINKIVNSKNKKNVRNKHISNIAYSAEFVDNDTLCLELNRILNQSNNSSSSSSSSENSNNNDNDNKNKNNDSNTQEGEDYDDEEDDDDTAFFQPHTDVNLPDVALMLRAIKRIQNTNNVQDLCTLHRFLLLQRQKQQHQLLIVKEEEEQEENHQSATTTLCTYTNSDLCSLLARLAVAAMHMKQYNSIVVAKETIEMRREILQEQKQQFQIQIQIQQPMESAAIVRALLRSNNTTQAVQMLDEELAVPSLLEEWNHDDQYQYQLVDLVPSVLATAIPHPISVRTYNSEPTQEVEEEKEDDNVSKEEKEDYNDDDGNNNDEEDAAVAAHSRYTDQISSTLVLREILIHRSLSLVSIACRYFDSDEPYHAVQMCEQLSKLGPIVRSIATAPGSGSSTNRSSTGLSSTMSSPVLEQHHHQKQKQQEQLNVTMPWVRLLYSASQCQSRLSRVIRDNNINSKNATAATPILPRAGIRHVGSDSDSSSSSSSSIPTTSVQTLPCNLVYAVLKAMTTYPHENDDRIYELVANSLVRRVVFVTGTVSMDGLPPSDRGEAAFIGRSNVGKSSLINMVTNRKSLAYTSKRPGKTQQINFFAVNDKIGREKEIRYGDYVPGTKDPDSFYIVDLPGYGYAAVPPQQRKQWLEFMHRYLSERTTLKVVFHLIDSRIGPTPDDATMMKQVSTYLPKSTSYVIVLTKADKNVKGNINTNNNNNKFLRGKVPPSIVRTLRTAMQENGIGNSPILVTSSETKLGRDDIWRYLRVAAEA